MRSYGENSVIGRDVSVIDVPLVHETSYDYDDMNGVIDDRANPYDQTKPIEVHIPSKSQTAIEALGGKCRICKDTTVLSIRRIRDPYRVENSIHLKKMVEEMIEKRKDPSYEFCIICRNCIMYIKKISNARKSSGLSELTIDDLEQIFTK
jgi:hypothetical protein